ncbi:MAG TPA: PrsW family glutamic-type intramembrane protease [Vicinamibacterales bacterium]|nr:PrsW family glutamic-type intramembrane protease [Vicinamibacterales bacterium]
MHQLIALAPGLIFLLALWLMDTFRLVRPSSIVTALLYGGAAAVACETLHLWLIPASGLEPQPFSRYVAPITEEAAKALFVAVLISRGRVGFLVDAAVLGFAVGTGFALVENLTYLRDFRDGPLMLWAVRGLGTGVLHAATTAVAAIVTKVMADRHWRTPLTALPGLALAMALHSIYNHLLVFPTVAAMVVLVALPIVVVTVFEQSERATRDWIGAGLDLDLTLLQLIVSEGFQSTRFGRYLAALPERFSGAVVADMFCLLRIELELAVQAKARLIAQQAGLQLPVDPDVHAALAEREYLQRSIGRTGLLALEPLRITSHRDYWHQHLLSQ